jgi:bacillithiol system protein YtxJ
MKLIYKHSYRCPVSRRAKVEVDAFLEHNTRELEYEFVDVIENRPRSMEIAEQYGIQHESPQIILLNDNGAVQQHASHGAITTERIKEAVS